MKSIARRDRARWVALVILCLGMFMIFLDSSIVNVALPSIQAELGFSQSSLTWVVNAYMIAFGGLLLLAGRLGDLVGRKRIFIFGLILFTAASLACGFAQAPEHLVIARFVQGVGGALTSAVILGMIVTLIQEPRDQAHAIGIYSFVASGGASLGLLTGGVLTQMLSWNWIFFVNVPVGIGAALMTLAMTGVSANNSGLGSGSVNTTQQAGGALGLAVLGTLASARSETLVQAGQPMAMALTGGYQLAFATGAGLLVAGLVIAVGRLGGVDAVTEDHVLAEVPVDPLGSACLEDAA